MSACVLPIAEKKGYLGSPTYIEELLAGVTFRLLN